MDEHARTTLLWGLDALAWVFRGADGGRWADSRALCLPRMAGVLLLLESRGLEDEALFDLAERVHGQMEHNDPAADPEWLEMEYVRLFLNHREGIPVPLCHSCYLGDGLMMAESSLAMQSRLEQAGLRVDASMALHPDHVAVEVAYLMALLSGGVSKGAPESGEHPSAFAAQMLRPWIGMLRTRLVQADAAPFFQLAAALLVALVEAIANADKVFLMSSP